MNQQKRLGELSTGGTKTLAQLVLLWSCLLQLVSFSSLFHILGGMGFQIAEGVAGRIRIKFQIGPLFGRKAGVWFLDVFACAESGWWCSEVGVNQSYLDHWVSSSSSSLPHCTELYSLLHFSTSIKILARNYTLILGDQSPELQSGTK